VHHLVLAPPKVIYIRQQPTRFSLFFVLLPTSWREKKFFNYTYILFAFQLIAISNILASKKKRKQQT